MIKLAFTTKLPLNICKGSYENRFRHAEHLNSELFNKINLNLKEKDLSTDIFEKHIAQITENKINFNIIDSTGQKFKGKTILALNPKNPTQTDRYLVALPLNQFDKKLSIYDTEIFMHEFFHFFCALTNPKHSQRIIKMFEKNLLPKTEPFYIKYLYNKGEFNKKDLAENVLPNFLSTIPIPDRIDFLQNSRYRLKEELHAYQAGHNYSDKIQDEHLDLISEKINSENGDSYHFQEKINILNNALKKVLNRARHINQ